MSRTHPTLLTSSGTFDPDASGAGKVSARVSEGPGFTHEKPRIERSHTLGIASPHRRLQERLFPNRGALLPRGLSCQNDLMREPCGRKAVGIRCMSPDRIFTAVRRRQTAFVT